MPWAHNESVSEGVCPDAFRKNSSRILVQIGCVIDCQVAFHIFVRSNGHFEALFSEIIASFADGRRLGLKIKAKPE